MSDQPPPTDITAYTFRVFYSPADTEWVGVCDQIPSLSYLCDCPVAAIEGVHTLVANYVDDMAEGSST